MCCSCPWPGNTSGFSGKWTPASVSILITMKTALSFRAFTLFLYPFFGGWQFGGKVLWGWCCLHGQHRRTSSLIWAMTFKCVQCQLRGSDFWELTHQLLVLCANLKVQSFDFWTLVFILPYSSWRETAKKPPPWWGHECFMWHHQWSGGGQRHQVLVTVISRETYSM